MRSLHIIYASTSGNTEYVVGTVSNYLASRYPEIAVESQRAELGITVNVIAPGAIDTPMVNAAHMPKDAMKALISHIPMARMGKPEEVAAAVVFLASPEASYVTGATLYVDGGWLAA